MSDLCSTLQRRSSPHTVNFQASPCSRTLVLWACSFSLSRAAPCRLAKAHQSVNASLQQAVLVKLHIMGELRQDFIDSLRAVAVEVMEGGYQFFMLLDVRQSCSALRIQSIFTSCVLSHRLQTQHNHSLCLRQQS